MALNKKMSSTKIQRLDSWVGSSGRSTRQRQLVKEALQSAKRPVSAQELFLELGVKKEETKVSLATIYRTLKGMAAAGLVDTFREDSGETTYLLCDEGHHHHLSCRVCGEVVDIRDCGIDRWASEAANIHGFSNVEHRVELIGTCTRCSDAG